MKTKRDVANKFHDHLLYLFSIKQRFINKQIYKSSIVLVQYSISL